MKLSLCAINKFSKQIFVGYLIERHCWLYVWFGCLFVQMRHINWMNREDLETVLLKSAVLACHKTTADEATAIIMLCKVSHIWGNVIMNCPRRKKVAFLQCIDRKSCLVFLAVYQTVSSLYIEQWHLNTVWN